MCVKTLYNKLKKSNLSLIGYSFKNERLKDELLSKLPHISLSNISSSFSLKSYIRDLKISNLLENDQSNNIDYIVIDTTEFIISDRRNIEEIIGRLRIENNNNYKIILTSPVNTPVNTLVNNSMITGNSLKPLLYSDFSFLIKDNSKVEIIKDRYSTTSQKTTIDVSNIKDYSYI